MAGHPRCEIAYVPTAGARPYWLRAAWLRITWIANVTISCLLTGPLTTIGLIALPEVLQTTAATEPRRATVR